MLRQRQHLIQRRAALFVQRKLMTTTTTGACILERADQGGVAVVGSRQGRCQSVDEWGDSETPHQTMMQGQRRMQQTMVTEAEWTAMVAEEGQHK
jgi:hypothetical protein